MEVIDLATGQPNWIGGVGGGSLLPPLLELSIDPVQTTDDGRKDGDAGGNSAQGYGHREIVGPPEKRGQPAIKSRPRALALGDDVDLVKWAATSGGSGVFGQRLFLELPEDQRLYPDGADELIEVLLRLLGGATKTLGVVGDGGIVGPPASYLPRKNPRA
jgi:hypothetical protein